MSIQNKVGQRIRTLRQEKNMSQEDLSFSCDLDRSYLSGVESGRRNISINNIEKIAHAFNLSIQQFFDSDEFRN